MSGAAKLLVLAAALLGPSPAMAAAAADLADGGITGRLALEDAGDATRLDLAFQDAAGQAIDGARPVVMLSRDLRLADDPAACRSAIGATLSGHLLGRIEATTSGVELFTLHRDGSLAVLDPTVGFSRTRMRALLAGGGPAAAAATASAGAVLLVARRAPASLLVVDPAAARVTATVPLPPDLAPSTLIPVEDGKGAWLDDAKGAVVLVDVAAGIARTVLAPARTRSRLALGPEQGRIAAVRADEPLLRLFDAASGASAGSVQLPAPPLALAVEPRGRLAWIVTDRNELVASDGAAVVARLPLDRPAVFLGGDAERRRLFLRERTGSGLAVLDGARRTLGPFRPMPFRATQMTVGRDQIYLLGPDDGRLAVLDRARADDPAAAPALVPIGQAGLVPDDAAGPLLLPSPDGTGAIVQRPSTAELAVYFDGMMVPAGSLRGFRPDVVGLFARDPGLVRTGPGRWAARLPRQQGGAWTVLAAGESPRFAACASLTLDGPPPAPQAPALRLVLEAPATVAAGEPVPVRLRVAGGALGEERGRPDLLVFEPPGLWRRRLAMRADPAGGWRGEVSLPHAGAFIIRAELAHQAVHASMAATEQPKHGGGDPR